MWFILLVESTYNTKSPYAWIETGKEKEISSVSGRLRVNINGVMNAENSCEVVIVESKSVNSDSTLILYQKLEELHPEAKNIYAICDNTRYYKNKLLNENLKDSNL